MICIFLCFQPFLTPTKILFGYLQDETIAPTPTLTTGWIKEDIWLLFSNTIKLFIMLYIVVML